MPANKKKSKGGNQKQMLLTFTCKENYQITTWTSIISLSVLVTQTWLDDVVLQQYAY